MCNKKTLVNSKINIMIYILLKLVYEKRILKSEILSLGIAKQTMYNYIMELKTILIDNYYYNLMIISQDDYYIIFVEN